VFNPPEWSPRYLPWMALGGTLTKIPQAILDLVANTQVLGVSRDASVGNTASANMLQVAQNLCYGVANVGALGSRPISPTTLFENRGWTDLNRGSGLIVTNGDAELWHHVCARDNPPPIRALQVGGTEESRNLTGSEFDLYWPASYPATAAIGDDRGRSQPQLKGDNIFPWCVVAPSDPSMAEWVAAQKTFDQKPLPICPAEFLTAENQFKVELDDQARYHYPDAQKWALRGAINAGLAVFVYLDDLIGNDTPANPRFNECELLSE
jgi:hypothetical protein